LSAAKAAEKGGDLTQNFDVGGAPKAGSLEVPNADLYGEAIAREVAGFSEKAKKDPQIQKTLSDIADLRKQRVAMQAEMDKLTDERNRADPAGMQDLTKQLDAKNAAYQKVLVDTVNKEDELTKRHKDIDNEESPVAQPAPPAGQAAPKP
jgi:hypothetical protein